MGSKRVAILTSGGDSPGMNAAIRAFVRRAIWEGYKVVGIFNGYEGLLKEDFKNLNTRDVGMKINRGGTFLKTSRSKKFMTAEGQKQAAEILKRKKIDALCVIGGDGSFRGMKALSQYYNGQLIGIPGTIDNDIPGTEYTIGFDTAIDTAVQAIDKLRDTAASHGRIFLVEVMGRNSGQIALSVALACGAEDVLIPEEPTYLDKFMERMLQIRKSSKRFGIVVVSEGDDAGGAIKIAEVVQEKTGVDLKVTILGHIQRGGRPSTYDRVWASKMGESAVRFIKNDLTQVFTAMKGGNIVPAYLSEATSGIRTVSPDMVKLIRILGA